MDFTEQELEDYIIEVGDLEVNDEYVTIIDRQVNVSGYRIDLVGKDYDGNIYLFELKKGTIDGNALSQLLNYMDYAKIFNKGIKKKIYGVLVGTNINDYMKSAVNLIKDVFYLEVAHLLNFKEQKYSYTEEYLKGDDFKKNKLAFNELFKGSEREDRVEYERSQVDQDNN